MCAADGPDGRRVPDAELPRPEPARLHAIKDHVRDGRACLAHDEESGRLVVAGLRLVVGQPRLAGLVADPGLAARVGRRLVEVLLQTRHLDTGDTDAGSSDLEAGLEPAGLVDDAPAVRLDGREGGDEDGRGHVDLAPAPCVGERDDAARHGRRVGHRRRREIVAVDARRRPPQMEVPRVVVAAPVARGPGRVRHAGRRGGGDEEPQRLGLRHRHRERGRRRAPREPTRRRPRHGPLGRRDARGGSQRHEARDSLVDVLRRGVGQQRRRGGGDGLGGRGGAAGNFGEQPLAFRAALVREAVHQGGERRGGDREPARIVFGGLDAARSRVGDPAIGRRVRALAHGRRERGVVRCR